MILCSRQDAYRTCLAGDCEMEIEDGCDVRISAEDDKNRPSGIGPTSSKQKRLTMGTYH